MRDSMQSGNGEAFWVANGYAAGAEGLAALNKDIEEALGPLGVAVATDELNANEANSTANGQPASSGAQNAQPASGETQATQPTQPTQTAQPVQTQGTEPVIQMPEYELYSLAEPEQTAAEQIQQAQQDANLRDLERLGVDLPEGASELQYSNLGDPNSTAGLNSDDYYIDTQNITDEDYAKELIKQLNYYHKQGDDDAFLTQNGYAAGEEGKQALIADVQERIGIEGLIEYWDDLMANEASNGGNGQHVISGIQDAPSLEGGYVDNYNYGLNNTGGAYPMEPSPGPLPQSPPVPEDYPDMEAYNEELGQYWDEYDAWHDSKMIQEANDMKDILKKREDEGKPPYEALNETDTAIDQETINNIVVVGYDVNGALSEQYQEQYEQGNIVEIQINDFSTYELSQDEALALYYEEQEQRNELVSDIIGIIGTKGELVKSVIFLGNKLLGGNDLTEDVANSAIDGLSIDDTMKSALKVSLQQKGIEAFLNAIDTMHYNVRNIEGGSYIEAEIVHQPKDVSIPVLVQSLRIFEVDGVYIYDELNPLCDVTSETF